LSRYVVDTSVAAKWFLDEEHSEAALRLLDAEHELHAPDFLEIELDHVLTKKHRRGELSRDEAEEIRRALAAFPLQRHPTDLLRNPAFDLSCLLRRSVYDCLFLTAALLLEAPLVTADRRLFEATDDDACPEMVWVGDL